MNGRISLSVANQIPPQSETAPPVLLSQTQHSTPRVHPSLPQRRSSEHVAGDRAPGGHGRAAGPVLVPPGAGEAAPARPPLLRRLPLAGGGGVLVVAAEEGDQAPHEDAAQEDAAVGHQAPPHAVPAAAAAPARLDARRIRHHGTRDPHHRGGCGRRPHRRRLRQPWHVAKRLKLFP